MGSIEWIVLSGPALRATVWYCAGTGELRETVSGPALTGFEMEWNGFHRRGDTATLQLREVSLNERVRHQLGSRAGSTGSLRTMRPTGAKVVDAAGWSWD